MFMTAINCVEDRFVPEMAVSEQQNAEQSEGRAECDQ